MENELTKAVEALTLGKVILYPTDTIWGLGCDPTNEEAVKRIYSIKQRKDSKPFIVLISQIEQLHNYVVQIPDLAWDLVEFAEKPLTVIYPKGKNVAPQLLGEDGSIAIRMVKDEFCKKLIKKFRKGIVATSANISEQPSAENFKAICAEIRNGVDYIVNWRQDDEKKTKASTLIKLELNGEIKFLRK